jgi:LuxR family maltose regulon positive regulatory protein
VTVPSLARLGDGAALGHQRRPPRVPVHLVPREHLVRRLDRLAPITLLEALPGYGKTTLAAVWAERRRRAGDRVVWLHVDPSSDDVEVLWEQLTEVLTSPLPGRTIVVVDGLDAVADSAATALLCSALARHRHVHVLICVELPSRITAVADRFGLDVERLTGEDLAIGLDELPAFAAALGHSIGPDRASELRDAVGGWIVPLRLVLDATPAASDLALEAAAEFFESTVLPTIARHPEARLAGRVALAEPLTAVTVAAALKDAGRTAPDGHQLLADLHRIGAMSGSAREGAGSRRFPSLLRQSLVSAFEHEHPSGSAHVHRQISEALYRSGASLGPVLVHARAGHLWPMLSHLWAEHTIQLTIDHPEAVEAYAELPTEALAAQPLLAVPGAVADALRAHPDDRDRSRVMRRYAEAGRGQHDPWGADDLGELVGRVVPAMVGLRGEGDLVGARRLALRLDRRVPVTQGLIEGGAARRAAWFALQWGLTELLAGDLPRAAMLAESAFDAARASDVDFIASHAAGVLALVHAYTGQTEEARLWSRAQQRYDTTGQWTDRLVTHPARTARTLLALDELDEAAATGGLADVGDGTEALEMWPFIAWAITRHALLFGEPIAALAHLDRLAQVHGRRLRPDGIAQRIVERARADLLIALGEVHRAQRLIVGVGQTPSWLTVPSARLHVITGDAAKARRIVSTGVRDAEATVRERAELLMIGAAAAHDHGDAEAAQEALTFARTIARPAALRDVELLVPREVAVPGAAVSRDIVEGTVGARRPYPSRAEMVRLSRRETTVLELLHSHASLAHIARLLSVSVNTVKKQVVAVYSKLGVHDRGSALLAARSLGLAPAQPRNADREDHRGTKKDSRPNSQ